MNVQQTQELFENSINALEGHSIEKKSIGYDQSNTYEMFGYIITPNSGYNRTITYTSFIHGNEPYNPLAMIMLFKEIGNKNTKYKLIRWLANNARFIVVFMCNPWGRANNNRLTSTGVNLNRNFDYAWEENVSDEADKKGTAALSEAESKNIYNFFRPYINEISFHVDWHDFVQNNAAYAPAGNKYNIYDSGIDDVRKWLENANSVKPTSRIPYVNMASSIGNQFADSWGIPSVTSEQSRAYWNTTLKLDLKDCILRAVEMSLNLHVPFLNAAQNEGAFYGKVNACALRSEKTALNSWESDNIISQMSKISLFTVSNGIFTNNISNPAKIVMFITDYNASNNLNKLVLLRVMQEIESINATYINFIKKKCKLIFAPFLNSISDINSAIDTYSPDLVVYVKNGLVKNFTPIVQTTGTFTKYIQDNYDYETLLYLDSIESVLSNFVSIKLNEKIDNPDRYGYTVAEWIRCILNSTISLIINGLNP